MHDLSHHLQRLRRPSNAFSKDCRLFSDHCKELYGSSKFTASGLLRVLEGVPLAEEALRVPREDSEHHSRSMTAPDNPAAKPIHDRKFISRTSSAYRLFNFLWSGDTISSFDGFRSFQDVLESC